MDMKFHITLTVDREKCIKCGLCADICPCGSIGMADYPEVARNLCMSCGHCTAVCPAEALDNSNAPLVNQIPLDKYSPAAKTLITRRSIRKFKDKPVPRQKLLELLDIAHFAPTAINAQGISYLIVDDKKTLSKVTEAVIVWEEEKLSKGRDIPVLKMQVDRYRDENVDSVLFNAPALIIALADKDLQHGRENALLSVLLAQIYAPSLELGTCWAGMVEYCAISRFPLMMDALKIPDGKAAAAAFMVGYPAYSYKRVPQREALDIKWSE